MVKIDGVSFGKIIVNGLSYKDILIVGEDVFSRNKGALRAIYGTSHFLSEEEVKQLLHGSPQAIVIGAGYSKMLQVSQQVVDSLKKSCLVFVLTTPEAVKKFNRLKKEKKKVNALFHTTC
jgi:hypothetical protein